MAIYQRVNCIQPEYEPRLWDDWNKAKEQDNIDHTKDVRAIRKMFYVRRGSHLEYGDTHYYNHWLAGFGMSHKEWDEFRYKGE